MSENQGSAKLIASDRVEGTDVYRSNGKKVGSIERLMINKETGKVAYAIMSFGGILGMGHHHYPLPWSLLKFNTDLDGYEVDVTDAQLAQAPKYERSHREDPSEKRLRELYQYYAVPYSGVY